MKAIINGSISWPLLSIS